MSEWRDRLRPASFRGVEFHVEISARVGGRRIQMHEFPKRDQPYAEDLGRRGRLHPVTAYLIGGDYVFRRDDLVEALEREGAGALVHPTMGSFNVVCSTYNITERRERGGFCEIECQFMEAGARLSTSVREATDEVVKSQAETTSQNTAAATNESVSV